jgi:hypothetical protein
MILVKERLMEIIPYLNHPAMEIIHMLTMINRANLINSKQIIVTSTRVVYHYLAVVFNQSDDNLLTIAPPHNA